MDRVIRRLLIANRGEIAVRIARAARELGMTPLGIYSEADREALHRELMVDSVCIGPPAATSSYLNTGAVLAAAQALKADAIHPGYGFLSERPDFARAVRDAGITFVGPSPEAMAAIGSKRQAKALARANGVPVVPGYDGAEQSAEHLRAEAQQIGPPLLIKASAGGGGRGMRVVTDLTRFDEALQSAQREAQSAFGDSTVLLERYLESPRHIEFQILGDAHGNTLHIGERECSIQRRHQKVIEEAPSTALSEALRSAMGTAAVRLAKAVDYVNAGTLEFMLDSNGDFYFLEMNTRLQVEHPVTESVYGIDLVHWQLRIASGERLTLSQEALAPRGSSIEARIYAEDPFNQMLPSTGTIALWDAPSGPGIRVDSGVRTGSEVSMYYDPMLAKLIVWGEDRATAVKRMQFALDSFSIAGVQTNIPLLAWIVRNDAFRQGDTTTAFFDQQRADEHFAQRPAATRETLALAVAAALENGCNGWRLGGIGVPVRLADADRTYAVEASAIAASRGWKLRGELEGSLLVREHSSTLAIDLDGKPIEGTAICDGSGVEVVRQGRRHHFAFAEPPSLELGAQSGAGSSGAIISPMPGRIIKIAVATGDTVSEHALLMVLEAMKMEHRIEAPSAGVVARVLVNDGDLVSAAAPLVEIE